MKPECVSCGDEFNPRRFALGYYVCLECGDEEATKQILKKSKCTAPAYDDRMDPGPTLEAKSMLEAISASR